MICQLPIIFFFCPFGILQYKFLSYMEVLHVLSEPSELSKLSELIELPEVFSSMKKCLLQKTGGPTLWAPGAKSVSQSSETSRSFGTTQSSISLCPAFPDACTYLTIWWLYQGYVLLDRDESHWIQGYRDGFQHLGNCTGGACVCALKCLHLLLIV